MLSTSVAALAYAPVPVSRVTTPKMSAELNGLGDISFDSKPWGPDADISTKDGMVALANKLNPTVGFWDPLGIVEGAEGNPETLGWFRHAEIKHGRVAMAAFVGYCVQSNGICFPWNLQQPLSFLPGGGGVTDTISFADISAAGGPADQWDALPTGAKVQILGLVAFLEMWSESPVNLANAGTKHYVRGGKPGVFPSFEGNPHPVPLNLWDPFGFTKKMTPERKEKALLAEINNGRLAMIGIFGLISASKGLIVPGLDGLGITPYSGEVMAPFSATNSDLTFVPEMLKVVGTLGY
jgi:hypothetical protein